MTITENLQGTVSSIYSAVSTDVLILRDCLYTGADKSTIFRYFTEVYHLNRTNISFIRLMGVPKIKSDIGEILRSVIYEPTYSNVEVAQIVSFPYFFRITVNGRNYTLPLGVTRQLLKLFKMYKVKVCIYKRDKSILDEDTVILMELCCKGKTDKMKDVYNDLVKECKKIKVTYNPWYAEEPSDIQDNPSIDMASARFRGAEWFNAAQNDIMLVGAGGLGSNIAVSLCRVMGNRKLIIKDNDVVDHVNLAGQNFGITDIGNFKSSVVAEQCRNFNPTLQVEQNTTAFGIDSVPCSITICGLDNMATRALVFSKWEKVVDESEEEDKGKNLLIDARMSAETWQIFCIEGNDMKARKEYLSKWLFSDEEADSDVCSYKQTAFAAQMCAGFVTNLYINHCFNTMKKADDPLKRYLPFMTEYDASQMILRHQTL